MFSKGKSFSNSGIEYLIVGLGNPGGKYEMTRHNAGFLAIDLIGMQNDIDVNKLKYHALVADTKIGDKRCLIMKPQTMMNNSGVAVGEAAKFHKIPPEKIIVICDDVSLDVGKLRIRRKGSAGGHNGLKSIIASIGSQDFIRIKVGVGKKPTAEYDLADWVLGTFPKECHDELKKVLENAVKATQIIVNENVDKAMNLYNS